MAASYFFIRGGKTVSEELVRINKLLSDAGVCSRREADRLV